MGDMALGYGSEFHLLRWLGRHRRLFTEKVCEAANRAAKRGWKHIDWLDFEFADGRLVPDSELCGPEFLTIGTDRKKWPKEWEKVHDELRNGPFKWPDVDSKYMMNWDVVGVADDGTYVLGEAKAHIEEIGAKCSATSENKPIIKQALKLPKDKDCFNAKEGKDWLGKYYQLANRLYMVSLLERCGLKAVFLYILFTGDKFPGRAKATCPASMEDVIVVIDDKKKKISGWRGVLDDEYKALGLDRESPYFQKHVIELGLPVVESQLGSGVWKR